MREPNEDPVRIIQKQLKPLKDISESQMIYDESVDQEIIKSQFCYLEYVFSSKRWGHRYRVHIRDFTVSSYSPLMIGAQYSNVFFNRDNAMELMADIDEKLTNWIRAVLLNNDKNMFN